MSMTLDLLLFVEPYQVARLYERGICQFSWFEIPILNIRQISLSVGGCAFFDWPVGIGPPSLKYSNTLHVKFGVSTSEIIIDSCIFKSLFTTVHLQSVSLKPSRPTILYFVLYIVFEQTFRFAYLRRGEGGFLMDVGTSLYSMEGQIILLLSWVYLHMSMIL